MNILFLTQYFPPETGAAPERAFEFARCLNERGHRVQVITAFPNHPVGIIHANYRGKLVCRERLGDIEILRTYVYARVEKTLINRLMNHLSFSLSALIGLFAVKKPDVILTTIPPLFLGATGVLCKYLMRRPLVLDVRDLWPRAAVDLGEMKESFITGLLTRLELFLYKRSDRITVVTKGIRDDLASRMVPEEKIRLATNGVNTAVFEKMECPRDPYGPFGLEGKFIVVYAGVIGIQHGTEFIAEAASMLAEERDIAFVFMGEGVKKEALQKEVERRGLANVHFVQSQPVESLIGFLSCSHAGLVTLRDLPFSNGIIPVKMFSYMSCGLPVLLAARGESREIMERSGAGICLEPENPRQLADAVMALYRDPMRRKELGARGRKYVETFYSRQAIAEKLEDVLREAI